MSHPNHPTPYGREPAVRSVGWLRLVAQLGAALAALVIAVLFLPGAPAAADPGPLALAVTGDGAHGVNVVVTWKQTGKPVLEPVDMTFTAIEASGQKFGPVQLVSSGEGLAFYESPRGLPNGTWRVMVTATKPRAAQESVTVVSRDVRNGHTTTQSASSSNRRGGVGTLGGVAIAAGAAILIAASYVLYRAVRHRRLVRDGR